MKWNRAGRTNFERRFRRVSLVPAAFSRFHGGCCSSFCPPRRIRLMYRGSTNQSLPTCPPLPPFPWRTFTLPEGREGGRAASSYGKGDARHRDVQGTAAERGVCACTFRHERWRVQHESCIVGKYKFCSRATLLYVSQNFQVDETERKRKIEKDRLAAIREENAKQRKIRAQTQR